MRLFQTTRDLLGEASNATRDRIHATTSPSRPRRVTPAALHELRDAIVRREQRSRRGSRPRERGSASRDRPFHPRRVTPVAWPAKRNAIVRAGNRRAAASRPAVARTSRARHLRLPNPSGCTRGARGAAQDAAVADAGSRLRRPRASARSRVVAWYKLLRITRSGRRSPAESWADVDHRDAAFPPPNPFDFARCVDGIRCAAARFPLAAAAAQAALTPAHPPSRPPRAARSAPLRVALRRGSHPRPRPDS